MYLPDSVFADNPQFNEHPVIAIMGSIYNGCLILQKLIVN